MATATKVSIPLEIAQYEDGDYTLYAYDQIVSETGKVTGRTRMDLSAATLYFQVRDLDDVIVLTKTSATATEILINPDQVTATTKGTALLYIDGIDTQLMKPGARYVYDVWVERAGRNKRLVVKSPFIVLDGVYEPPV